MGDPSALHRSMFLLLVTGIFALLVRESCAEFDDWVTQYCVGLNHQSVSLNGKIWIDGGTVLLYNRSDADTNAKYVTSLGYNNKLLELDLTHDWALNWNFQLSGTAERLYTRHNKTQLSIPVLNRGALFAGPDGDTLSRYGGTVSFLNQSAITWRAPGPINQPLWSYRISTGTWNVHQSQGMEIPNAGAHAEAPQHGLAFYIHGQVDRGSAQERSSLGNNSYLVDGMIIVNTRDGTMRNVSTSSMVPSKPTTRGAAITVSKIGTHGIIVKLGGSLFASQIDYRDDNADLLDFKTINVFDIGQLFNDTTKNSPVWYQQRATGDIPSPRINFCLVTVSAPDNTSHHVYLYGGTDRRGVFAGVYVLSLPAFVWTYVYDDPWGRAYQTCHVVAESRLVSIGGTNTANGFVEYCDAAAMGIQIYDMNGNFWTEEWNSSSTQYRVNANVTRKIGGGPSGNSSMSNPDGGFSDNRMSVLFSQKPIDASIGDLDQQSTNDSRARKLGLGVGLGIGLPIVLAVAVWCFYFLPYEISARRGGTHGMVKSKPIELAHI